MSTRFLSRLRTGSRAMCAAAVGFSLAFLRRYGLAFAAAFCPLLLAACGDTPGDFSERAYHPLSAKLLAEMQEKGTTPAAPVLIRAFKKEAEVQLWKMRADGHYALFKSYPICRWSGQLGPKKREGDRQVPEGFYAITPEQMNPRSNYYLSFNVGYPNAYDRARGYTGGNIMVHGVCSSAGCFSMTDQQIAEIYAIAREAFAGGQQAIQFQSYPFYMTPANFALYRLDPNMSFWKELAVGNDNFEVTKKDVAVGVCNEHYVFNAEPADGQAFDPTGPCPALKRDKDIALEVTAKEKSDDAKVAELVAEGVQPMKTVYADGGQNPLFRWRRNDVSRPDALAQGPVNIPLAERRALSLAQLEAAKLKAEEAATVAERKAAAAHAVAYVDPTPAPVAPVQRRSVQMPPVGLGLGHLFASKPQAPVVQPPPQKPVAAPQLAAVPMPPLPKETQRKDPRREEARRIGLRGTEPHGLAKLENARSEHEKREAKPGRNRLAHAKPAVQKPGEPRREQAKIEHPRHNQAIAEKPQAAPAKSAAVQSLYGNMPMPPSFSAAAVANDH